MTPLRTRMIRAKSDHDAGDHGDHPDAGAGAVVRLGATQWGVLLSGGAVMAGFARRHEAESWSSWYRARLAAESTCQR